MTFRWACRPMEAPPWSRLSISVILPKRSESCPSREGTQPCVRWKREYIGRHVSGCWNALVQSSHLRQGESEQRQWTNLITFSRHSSELDKLNREIEAVVGLARTAEAIPLLLC